MLCCFDGRLLFAVGFAFLVVGQALFFTAPGSFFRTYTPMYDVAAVFSPP